MEVVVASIYFIRQHVFNHSRFKKGLFLSYQDVLYYCEVRRLV